jgi:phage major head subunit gpT-like protein
MSIVRANLSNLMKVDLDIVMQEAWKNVQHELILNTIFNVITSDKKEEKHQTVGGMGLLAVKDEGNDLTNRTFREGYTTTYTHKTLGMYAQISMEAVDDEQYGTITKLPQAMSRSADATYSYYMSRIFGLATSTTDDFITGGDGVALLSTSHPLSVSGGTSSNTPSTAIDLTETSLWAGVDAFYEMLDDAGKPIANSPRYLLVPHQEQKKAYELVMSDKTPEDANNSINALRKAVSLEIVVWPYWLGSIDDDCWFLLADKNATDEYPLYMIRRKPYETEADNDFFSKDFLYSVVCRFSVGYSDWRFCYGTLGG